MKITAILPLILAAFLVSCTQKAQPPAEDHAQHNTAEKPQDHDGHAHQEEATLRLNDGKKWKVNEEMMVHVRSGETAIQAFSAAEEKKYTSLAAELKDNIDLLIKSCTMTGESHEQLHVWLMPYIRLVDDMATGYSEDQGAETFQKIQLSFAKFNQYFE